MRKLIVPILASLALLIAGFLIITQTNSYSDCIEDYKTEHTQKTPPQNNTPIALICSFKVLDTHNGVVSAIATFIIAIFTVVLAHATTTQNELTREAMIADKRAFIYASGIYQYWILNEETRHYDWKFRPIWNNSGDTPTKNMTMHAQCILSNTVLADDFDFNYATNNIGKVMVAPKATVYGGLAPAPNQRAITARDLVDVKKGDKFLYVMGWAKYFDVFPNTPQHITRFCWLILPNGDPLTFIPDATERVNRLSFDIIHNAKGNCADDECTC